MKKHTINSLFTKLIFLVVGLCILWLLVWRDRPSIGMLLLRYEGGGKILQDMSAYAAPTMDHGTVISQPVHRRRKIIVVAYPRKYFTILQFHHFYVSQENINICRSNYKVFTPGEAPPFLEKLSPQMLTLFIILSLSTLLRISLSGLAWLLRRMKCFQISF